MNPERLRQVERWVWAGVNFVLTDIAGLAGAGLIAFGAWRIYEPGGLITGGVLLLAGAWLNVRGG